ncbi:MAG: hypothetical protein WKG07_05510 [Hymenobacter sp.]
MRSTGATRRPNQKVPCLPALTASFPCSYEPYRPYKSGPQGPIRRFIGASWAAPLAGMAAAFNTVASGTPRWPSTEKGYRSIHPVRACFRPCPVQRACATARRACP